jgi:hypothetical protein
MAPQERRPAVQKHWPASTTAIIALWRIAQYLTEDRPVLVCWRSRTIWHTWQV